MMLVIDNPHCLMTLHNNVERVMHANKLAV